MPGRPLCSFHEPRLEIVHSFLIGNPTLTVEIANCFGSKVRNSEKIKPKAFSCQSWQNIFWGDILWYSRESRVWRSWVQCLIKPQKCCCRECWPPASNTKIQFMAQKSSWMRNVSLRAFPWSSCPLPEKLKQKPRQLWHKADLVFRHTTCSELI